MSVAQGGGGFVQGFACSAIGAAGGLLASASGSPFGSYGDGITELALARAAVSAAAGCAAAAVTGGKCAQAAVTAAFASLYNGDGLGRRIAAFGGQILGGFAGGLVSSAGAGACAALTSGACIPAGPALVGEGITGGAVTGGVFATSIYDGLEGSNDNPAVVHGNSKYSKQETELCYLINRSSGAIDKIGITSYPGERYSQGYLDAEGVEYVTKHTFSWRLPATVAETIELTFYKFQHGDYPRLNKTNR